LRKILMVAINLLMLQSGRMADIDPEDHLTYLMTQAAHGMGVLLDRALQDHDVTLRQFGALAHIGRHAGISGADLAQRLRISPQAAATLVRRMAAAGLVEHTKTGKGLAAQLRLTDHGRARLVAADAVAVRVEEEALHPIAPADRKVIEAALRVVIAHATDRSTTTSPRLDGSS
jgi:DNA-binding MarR family transcriptional regulator